MIYRLREFCRHMRKWAEKRSAMQIIAMVFLAIVLCGAVILTLPISAKSGQRTPFLTALFTATSCTCVTGLSLVDTFTHWSMFGQIVILLLIQIGGLGFMTVMTLFLVAMHRKIGLKEHLVIAQSFGMEKLSGLIEMVRRVLYRTLIIEAAGAVVLTCRFLMDMEPLRAIWCGIFHSVSAFCNAGFDILGAVKEGGSMVPYLTDPVVNITLMVLIVVGGLGFFVWDDLLQQKRFRKYSVYTKLVLVCSAVLIFGGAALYGVLEWNNPSTIGALPVSEKILASLFQSVTTRTAGFYMIPQGNLTDASIAVTDVLMFIGGGSGSTAGGAKMVTVGVLLLSVIATARGRSRVTVFHRTIGAEQIKNAVTVVLMMFIIAFVTGVVLSASNSLAMKDCLYESISAIATVGLSTGITGQVNVVSKMLLIILMFFGRVGIMTISLGFLFSDSTKERYRYADTKVLIG